MKARISANTDIDCAPMIVLEAENDSDILLLRFFERNCAKAGGVQIGSFGGNINEGRWSLNLIPKYAPEQSKETDK